MVVVVAVAEIVVVSLKAAVIVIVIVIMIIIVIGRRGAQTNVQMCSSCRSEKEFKSSNFYRHCPLSLFLFHIPHTTCHISHHATLYH